MTKITLPITTGMTKDASTVKYASMLPLCFFMFFLLPNEHIDTLHPCNPAIKRGDTEVAYPFSLYGT